MVMKDKDPKVNCIMLVDDNPADNFFHDLVLTEENFASQILMRESAVEALEYLQQAGQPQPDLIFLDINMPGLDGWQFLERYKKLVPNPADRSRIFMLTTSINTQDEKKAEATKVVSGFLTKPLDPRDLQAVSLKLKEKKIVGIMNN